MLPRLIAIVAFAVGVTALFSLPCTAVAQSSVPDASQHNGKAVPDRAPDKVIDGDLSKGKTMELAWAQGSGIGCWTATENQNWDGNHVLHIDRYGPSMDVVFRVTPEEGVDVSLYVLRQGEKEDSEPPSISRASCSVSYDKTKDNNPGVSEAVALRGKNRYRLIVGVAGAKKTTKGRYKLEIWDNSGK